MYGPHVTPPLDAHVVYESYAPADISVCPDGPTRPMSKYALVYPVSGYTYAVSPSWTVKLHVYATDISPPVSHGVEDGVYATLGSPALFANVWLSEELPVSV